MTIVQTLGIALAVGLVAAAIAWFLTRSRMNKSIENYNSIQDAIKAGQDKYNALKQAFQEGQKRLTDSKAELEAVNLRTIQLQQLEGRANEIRDLIENGKSRIEALKAEIAKHKDESETIQAEIHQHQSDLDLYTRLLEFVDYGIYEEPEYLHDTSERYKAEIDLIRQKQKDLIKSGGAVELPDDIQVEGSSQKGKSILSGQAKMMLRAFNLECDLLLGKLNPSNFSRSLERVERVADGLEKSAVSLMCGISSKYVELKFQEFSLYYEYVLKKAAEQEEQRLIREQMREEQKALMEYQRAIEAAEKEERLYADLLERARREMELAEGQVSAELAAKVQMLEQQLREAQEKEARAKSMAEQTRRGYVYIISNIGSFGDDVYKIGMTRRLEPLDRVKELGDASVPFPFDVHALVFSEDAPAMENMLHKKFTHRRVNAVNLRKEFFQVSLDEIKSVVTEAVDDDVDFRLTALAEEYYESQRLMGAAMGDGEAEERVAVGE